MSHTSGLTAEQIEEYFYRSYTRVDGLWFVLTEQRQGFDTALAIDEAVWRVMPKIQARLLQEQLSLARDAAGLARALKAKLALDRYEFVFGVTTAGFNITLSKCPWHDLILRSGRGHIAEKIGGAICGVEFPAFAHEFDCVCSCPPDQRLCRDGAKCQFSFSAAREASPGNPV